MGIPMRGTGAEQLRETSGVPSEAAALRGGPGIKPSASNSGVSQVAAENANSMDLGTSAIDQVKNPTQIIFPPPPPLRA